MFIMASYEIEIHNFFTEIRDEINEAYKTYEV